MKPKLRFDESRIQKIAALYEYPIAEDELIDLKPVVQKRGFLKKQELQKIAYWKAPRSSGHVNKNEDAYVREITEFSFRASTERARIQVLTNLDGVSWPTASVILHLFHHEPYPIMDFRALWSVTLEVPKQYSFDFWWPYVEFCREITHRNQVDMRILDRALWQYSKENQ